jgi:hypothetical protein
MPHCITSRSERIDCEQLEGIRRQCVACSEAWMECTFYDQQRYYRNLLDQTLAGVEATSPAQYIPLFDLAATANPHPTLMQLFIHTFFRWHSTKNDFISYRETVQLFNSGRLSPVLANAIAAVAILLVHNIESITGQESITMLLTYCDNVKASILEVS